MIAAIDPAAPQSPTLPVSGPAVVGRSVEELLLTVSASRLTTWLQCRLKFYFRYVAGIAKPNTPARHLGTVIHAVLQQWNLARWRGSPLDTQTLKSVFERAWAPSDEETIAWEQDGEENASKSEAAALVETYLRDTPSRWTKNPRPWKRTSRWICENAASRSW